jgi:hypothetical protein
LRKPVSTSKKRKANDEKATVVSGRVGTRTSIFSPTYPTTTVD